MYDEKLPSVFWGLMVVLMITSLGYLAILGIVEEGAGSPAFQVATFLFMLLVGSVVLSMGKILHAETNVVYSSQGFVAGFLLFLGLGTIGEASLISITDTLFEQQLAQLGQNGVINTEFWDWFIPTIAAPVTEEAFWAVGLPVGLVLLMQSIAKSSHQIRDPWVSPFLRLFENKIVQMIVLVLVLSTSFAFFHIDQQDTAVFILAALAFRAILTVIWWGDMHWDLVPYLVIAPSFLVGAHLGNNMVAGAGLLGSITIASTHPIGWITMAVFGFIFVIALLGLHKEFRILKNLLS